MPIRLAPTCDRCGARASGGGYVIDPESLEALCLGCAIPDESERERTVTKALRELARTFEKEHGRRPQSVQEFTDWMERAEDRSGVGIPGRVATRTKRAVPACVAGARPHFNTMDRGVYKACSEWHYRQSMPSLRCGHCEKLLEYRGGSLPYEKRRMGLSRRGKPSSSRDR